MFLEQRHGLPAVSSSLGTYKHRRIHTFLGPSWVLITTYISYNTCPPGYNIFLEQRHGLPAVSTSLGTPIETKKMVDIMPRRYSNG